MFLDRLADQAYEISRAPKTRIDTTITRNEAWKSTSRLEGAVIKYTSRMIYVIVDDIDMMLKKSIYFRFNGDEQKNEKTY